VHRTIAAVVLLLMLVVPSGAWADVLQDLGATFEQVAQELRAAFPKVESRIVAVEGSEVRLEGPAVASLRPGLELVAYRKGEPFRHPITNQPLGRAEDEVAVLSVTAVSGPQATARVATTEGGRTPRVGDGARITAGRIQVAVLPPLGANVPGETVEQTALLLVSRFSALLEKTGRFLAVEPRRVLETATPPQFTAAWIFALEPLDGGRTRLIERFRVRMDGGTPASRFLAPVLGFGVFVMTQRQMLGIKARAEKLTRDRAALHRDVDAVVEQAMATEAAPAD